MFKVVMLAQNEATLGSLVATERRRDETWAIKKVLSTRRERNKGLAIKVKAPETEELFMRRVDLMIGLWDFATLNAKQLDSWHPQAH